MTPGAGTPRHVPSVDARGGLILFRHHESGRILGDPAAGGPSQMPTSAPVSVPRPTHLAAAAAVGLLLAAPPASAQLVFDYPGARFYNVRGCDYAFAGIFGPGPRVCGSGTIGVGAIDLGNGNPLAVLQADIHFTGPTGYAFSQGDAFTFRFQFNDEGAFNVDDLANLGLVCENLCRGDDDGTFGPYQFRLDDPSYVFRTLTLGVTYYGDDVPAGTPRDPDLNDLDEAGVSYASSLTLVATPEPSPVLLAGAGVVLLGAWARRRQSA